MTASTVKSVNITSVQASPRSSNLINRKNGKLNTVVDQIALLTTSVDEIGDKVLIGMIPSNAVITSIVMFNDDLDAHATPTLAADVGLAYSGIGGNQTENGKVMGDVIDVDCFAAASTVLQSAVTAGTEMLFKTLDITKMGKEAWEMGGLSADPGGFLVVSLTMTAAAATAAAGDVVIKIAYI